MRKNARKKLFDCGIIRPLEFTKIEALCRDLSANLKKPLTPGGTEGDVIDTGD